MYWKWHALEGNVTGRGPILGHLRRESDIVTAAMIGSVGLGRSEDARMIGRIERNRGGTK
jgi:hypothetical protein